METVTQVLVEIILIIGLCQLLGLGCRWINRTTIATKDFLLLQPNWQGNSILTS